MRLHTSLGYGEIVSIFRQAKSADKITKDVTFVGYACHKSRTHRYAHEIQLGTYDQHSLPVGTVDQYGKHMHVRRFKNSGDHGASSGGYDRESAWAATWDEWGWFIAGVFEADPTARWVGGGNYSSPAMFHAATNGRFKSVTDWYDNGIVRYDNGITR